MGKYITKDWRNVLVGGGSALFYIINRASDVYDIKYWCLWVIALISTLSGCYIWTKLKNRHWAFMFWGLLTPIGLLGISLLKEKSKVG